MDASVKLSAIIQYTQVINESKSITVGSSFPISGFILSLIHFIFIIVEKQIRAKWSRTLTHINVVNNSLSCVLNLRPYLSAAIKPSLFDLKQKSLVSHNIFNNLL